MAGRLTRDVEVKHTANGTAVAELALAISERFKTAAGAWEEKAIFVDVIVWGRQAETSAEFLSKGAPVLVEGRLQLDRWETQAGEKRQRLKVRADRVQFLGSGKRDEKNAADRLPSAPPQGSGPAAVVDDEDIPF